MGSTYEITTRWCEGPTSPQLKWSALLSQADQSRMHAILRRAFCCNWVEVTQGLRKCEKQRRNTAASGAKNLTVLWTRSRIKATALCLCAFGAGIWQFTKPQNKRCHPAWATWAWPKEAWQHDQEKIRQHVTCCMGKVTCNKDPGWFASRLRITGLSCQKQLFSRSQHSMSLACRVCAWPLLQLQDRWGLK